MKLTMIMRTRINYRRKSWKPKHTCNACRRGTTISLWQMVLPCSKAMQVAIICKIASKAPPYSTQFLMKICSAPPNRRKKLPLLSTDALPRLRKTDAGLEGIRCDGLPSLCARWLRVRDLIAKKQQLNLMLASKKLLSQMNVPQP